MPLSAAQKTGLALWVTIARHLDRECGDRTDASIVAQRDAARGVLVDGAFTAAEAVKSMARLASYLEERADILASRALTEPGAKAAENTLRTLVKVLGDGDEDGAACDGTGPACPCGILELATLVEERIRATLLEARVDVASRPSIAYVTTLLDEGDMSVAPYKVTGDADIAFSPRVVSLKVKPVGLCARDLLHIVYTLHHELVCHGFQGALADEPVPNAFHTCHWSEGWMDTVAFDLACSWLAEANRPTSWLPMVGSDGRGELWEFHDRRYKSPPELKSGSDIDRRRFAREAYRCLSEALLGNEIARSKAEAEMLARNFSLALNAHPAAKTKRLKVLAERMRSCLLNKVRPEAGGAVAVASLAFLTTRNMEALETAVADAQQRP